MTEKEIIMKASQAIIYDIITTDPLAHNQPEYWLRFEEKIGVSWRIRKKISRIVYGKTGASIRWTDAQNITIFLLKYMGDNR